MKLVHLACTGLGPQDLNIRVSPRTLLAGENDAGKTTALRAIRIGLFGCDPERGPKASLEIARATEGSVTLVFEDNAGRELSITRTLDLSGATMKTTELVVVPGKGERSKQEAEARILAEVGLVPDVFSPAEFVGMTPGKRAEFLARFATGAPMTAESFLARLGAKDQVPPAAADLIRRKWQPRDTSTANIDRAATVLEESLKTVVQDQRAQEALVKQALSAKSEEDSGPGTARSLGEERAELRQQLETLITEHSRAGAEARGREEKRLHLDNSVTQLATARARHAEAMAASAKLPGLRAELAALRLPVEPTVETWEPDQEVMKRVAELRSLAAEVVTPNRPDLANLHLRVEAAEQRLKSLEADPWTRARALLWVMEMGDFKFQGGPLIGSAHWRALGRIVTEHCNSTGLAEAESAATEARQVLAQAVKADGEAREACAQAEEQRAKLLKEADDLEAKELAEVKRLQEEAGAAAAPARAEWQKQCAEIKPKMTALCERIASIEAEERSATRHLDQQIEQQRMAAAAVADAPPPVDLAELGKRKYSIDSQIQGLDARIATKERAKTHETNRIQAASKAEMLREQAQALRRLQAGAREQLTETIAATTGPILTQTSKLLHEMNPGWELDFPLQEGGIGIAARTAAGGPWVPFRALGGGFGWSFMAALALALVRLQGAKCEILTLDVAEMDDERLAALLRALTQLDSAGVASILVATCHPPADKVEGWATHRLVRPRPLQQQLAGAMAIDDGEAF